MAHFRDVALVALVVTTGPWTMAAHSQPAGALSYVQPLLPAQVQQVQDRLRAEGAFAGTVDGAWGPESAAALSQYQQTHGLQVTGQLNQATTVLLGLDPARLLALSAAPAVPFPPSAPPPPATPAAAPSVLGPAAVRNLQGRLRELGYYTGGIDGAWGPQAEAALRRFQQASGIEASGRINRETVAAMGLDPNDPAAPARP